MSHFLNSDLVWKRKSGKQTTVLAKGRIYSYQELTYWFDKKIELDLELNLNTHWLERGCLLLEKLQSLEENNGTPKGRDRFQWRLDFLDWIGHSLWKSEEEIKHDDLITLMMAFYYALNDPLDQIFHQFTHEVKMRNSVVASYMVITLICCGYTNHFFLQDIFNICLFLDYPYSLTMWSEREKKSMTRARANKVLSEIEKAKIVEKNQEFESQIIPLMKDYFTFPENVDLLHLSFERLDGMGFPNRVDYRNFSDMELCLLFLVNSFNYDMSFVGQSAKGFFRQSVDNEDTFLSRRLSLMIKKGFDQESHEFLKVAGL